MKSEALINKMLRLYILSSIFIAAAGLVFADGPSSSVEDRSSVDTGAVAGGRNLWPEPDVGTAGSDDQAGYFDDLRKLIEESHENIKTVNEKNKEQEVLKRNQKREEQARAYYEMGVELTNEGQLDEARAYFDKAIRIFEHPEMARYIQEANWVNPDYKVITDYARRIDKETQEQQQRVLEEQQKILHQQRRDEEIARSKAAALHRQELRIKEREHRQQLEEEVQFNYKAAIALFNNKAMDEALKNFNDIEKTCPDYRATTAYILHIKQWQFEQQQRRVEEQRLQQRQAHQQQRRQLELAVDGMYISALNHYRARNFETAQAEFLKVNKIIVGYKSTQGYLSKIEGKINQAQSLYQEAVALFDDKVIDEALEKFNHIEKIYPDFKSTRDYIVTIKQWQLKQQHQIEVQKRQEQQMRQLELEANETYISALKDYRAHHFTAAKEEFLRVEEEIPDYEFTQKYLSQLEAMPAQEEARKAELQRQEYERQAQLNARRQAAVRKQSEDSVKVMYQQAVRLYRQGQYAPAADKFKDIQDILPGYKRAGQYMDEAHRKAQEYERQRREEQRREIAKELAEQEQVSAIKGQVSPPAEEAKRRVVSLPAEEAQRKAELLRQEYRRQAQLNARREAVRKQLEDSVKVMYQQAVRLYRQGQYAPAADKFKDIQDILPGYKRAGQYMDEARRKAQEYERQRREEQRREVAKELAEQEQVSAIKGQVSPPAEETKRRAVSLPAEEAQRKAELLRQEYRRQAQLNARREAVRKQLEDGIEVLYQEAVRSYKQGQYAIAADKFKDIQDILPGYKRLSQYMDEARRKTQTAVMPPARSIPETRVLTDTSHLPSVSTPAGHQDAVSKALDLFDPNVK